MSGPAIGGGGEDSTPVATGHGTGEVGKIIKITQFVVDAVVAHFGHQRLHKILRAGWRIRFLAARTLIGRRLPAPGARFDEEVVRAASLVNIDGERLLDMTLLQRAGLRRLPDDHMLHDVVLLR